MNNNMGSNSINKNNMHKKKHYEREIGLKNNNKMTIKYDNKVLGGNMKQIFQSENYYYEYCKYIWYFNHQLLYCKNSNKYISIINLKDQSHTLGTVISRSVNSDVNIEYSAYKMIHPLDNCIVIHTQSDSNPLPCIIKSLDNTIQTANNLSHLFSSLSKNM